MRLLLALFVIVSTGLAILWLAGGSGTAERPEGRTVRRSSEISNPAGPGRAADLTGPGDVRESIASLDSAAKPPKEDIAPHGVVLVRITTPDGDPVPGLPLRVQHEAAGETKGYSLFGQRAQALAAECGEGRVQVEAITDAHGHAQFEGLAAGRYAVRTHSGPREHGSVYSVLLSGEEPVSAGSARAVLVFDRSFVSIELVGPEGGPWSGKITAPGRFMARAPSSWPEGAHVQLVEAIRGTDGWAVRELGRASPVLGRVTPGAALVTFNVKPETDYLLSVIGKNGESGFDGAPRHLRFAADEVHRRVFLRGRPLGDFGAVELVATVRERSGGFAFEFPADPETTAAPEARSRPEPRPLRVESGDHPDTALQFEYGHSGVILLEPEGWSSSPFRFEAPAGTYRIHGRAELGRPTHQFGARHGAAMIDVQVASFQVATAHLEVGEGGVVLVDVGEGKDSVYLELVAPSGRRMPFRWSTPMINGGASTNWWWPDGEITRSQPTPAGHYRLVGHRGYRQDGGTRYDLPITVEDGAELSVRLD